MPDSLKPFPRELRDRDVRPDSTQPTRGVFSPADSTAQDAAYLQQDEANMRRALGMLGNAARTQQTPGATDRRPPSFNNGGHSSGTATRRHRFVQDGDVPVTVVRARGDHASDPLRPSAASPINRLDALQESLAVEAAARATAERALEEAQSTIRTLQTKLSHLELARDEAVAVAQSRADEIAALSIAALSVENAATAVLPDAVLPDAVSSTSNPEAGNSTPVAAPVEALDAPKVTRPTRGRRPKSVDIEPEPEPVKWWITSQPVKTPATRRARARIAAAPTSE